MLTYLLGPFLSLLPARWRKELPFAESIKWRRAAFMSGVLQACSSLYALVYWYSYSVTHHTQIEISEALRAHPHVHVTKPEVGLVGLVFVALNVVTWIICWFGLEGIARALGAVFTGETVGTFPLWAMDRFCCAVLKWKKARRFPMTPDEVSWDAGTLMIKSCRPKPNWENHPTIRYKEEFFKVVEAIPDAGTESYFYRLRRLQPGEIIRGLESYEPHHGLQATGKDSTWESLRRALKK